MYQVAAHASSSHFPVSSRKNGEASMPRALNTTVAAMAVTPDPTGSMQRILSNSFRMLPTNHTNEQHSRINSQPPTSVFGNITSLHDHGRRCLSRDVRHQLRNVLVVRQDFCSHQRVKTHRRRLPFLRGDTLQLVVDESNLHRWFRVCSCHCGSCVGCVGSANQ